jgi:hypothetical protein
MGVSEESCVKFYDCVATRALFSKERCTLCRGQAQPVRDPPSIYPVSSSSSFSHWGTDPSSDAPSLSLGDIHEILTVR